MPRHTKLSHELKLEIVEKHRNGWKPFAILRHIQDVDRTVTIRNVRYLIHLYQTGSFSDVRQLQRPQAAFEDVTEEHIECIKNILSNDPTMSATDIARILTERGLEVSRSTVRRAIITAGWTSAKPRYCQLIRDGNKLKRKDFCQDLITTNEHFDDVIFTDESTIQLHDNKTVCYRPINGLDPREPKPKHPLKVHLWGGISRRGKTPLLIFEGIMEKTFYTEEILRNTLLHFIRRKFPDGHRFVQDNDPKHTSRYAQDFMTDNNINWWKCPAESCDLNPIEMVWNMLKRDVAKREPATKAEPMEYVQDFWREKHAREVCNCFIDHNYKVLPIMDQIDGKASGNLPKKLFPERSRGHSIGHFHARIQTAECQQLLQ